MEKLFQVGLTPNFTWMENNLLNKNKIITKGKMVDIYAEYVDIKRKSSIHLELIFVEPLTHSLNDSVAF